MTISEKVAPCCRTVALLLLAAGLCAPMARAASAPIPEIPLVHVKGGCFEMGDTFSDGGSDEKPVHRVCVGDYYLGKYEVTREIWQAVTGDKPEGVAGGGSYPVEKVSWNDVRTFITLLRDRTGKNWRLPTEAEWEYAARGGGKKERFPGTDDQEQLAGYAWSAENAHGQIHPVGEKTPNALGIHDMGGNVWEWVQDRYDRDYYRQSPMTNPTGDPFGVNRIIRGGSATSSAGFLRCSYRDYLAPDVRNPAIGFRLALDAK